MKTSPFLFVPCFFFVPVAHGGSDIHVRITGKAATELFHRLEEVPITYERDDEGRAIVDRRDAQNVSCALTGKTAECDFVFSADGLAKNLNETGGE